MHSKRYRRIRFCAGRHRTRTIWHVEGGYSATDVAVYGAWQLTRGAEENELFSKTMPGRVVKTNIRDLVQMMAERGILLAHNDDLAEGAAHVPDFEKRWHAYARPVGRIIEHKHGCKNWVRLSLLIGRDRSR
jgi:hypothetical protein